MSFDLYLCGKTKLSNHVLTQYFGKLPLFHTRKAENGSLEFAYENSATGVYFTLSSHDQTSDRSPGSEDGRLSFRLNYNRPAFFALEALALLHHISEDLKLLVEDPQELTLESVSIDRLLESWRHHNAAAVSALAAQKVKLRYFPEYKATTWWRYTRIRTQLEESLGGDIFVPQVILLQDPNGEVISMIVWSNGTAQFLPPCDYICFQQSKQAIESTNEGWGFVSYQALLHQIQSYVEDYDFGDDRLKLIQATHPDEVLSLTQKLELTPANLSEYVRLASDDFHDVDLGLTL